MESLRTDRAYFDGKFLWAVDNVVGGLYKINMETMEVACVIQPMELYRYDSFIVASIIEKDGQIIVIPWQVKHKWVFYDRTTGNISYQKVIDVSCNTCGVRVKENKVYIPPQYEHNPFIVYDLNEMELCLLDDTFLEEHDDVEVWHFFENNGILYFPLRGGNCIYSYGLSDNAKEITEVKIEEKLGDADGGNGEYWVLPLYGENIYHIDDRGNVVETIELVIDGERLKADDFVRIFCTDVYIFLLPVLKSDIYVYEKSKHRFLRIKREFYVLSNHIANDDADTLSYYGYIKTEKGIWFLPRSFKLLWIGFEDLSTVQRDIFLPDRKDYGMINRWRSLPRNDNIFIEVAEDSLSLHLDYMKNVEMDRDSHSVRIGKKIWNCERFI